MPPYVFAAATTTVAASAGSVTLDVLRLNNADWHRRP